MSWIHNFKKVDPHMWVQVVSVNFFATDRIIKTLAGTKLPFCASVRKMDEDGWLVVTAAASDMMTESSFLIEQILYSSVEETQGINTGNMKF